MTSDQPRGKHIFLSGTWQDARARYATALQAPPRLLPAVSAHRRLRGPYTAAGTIMRGLIPEWLPRQPDLIARHAVEILTVAPELRTLVPATHETLTSLAVPTERTRFYSRLRTLRIAHGLTELLRDLASAAGGRWSLVVEDLHEADYTDHEFIAVLLRRMDPGLLTVVAVGTPALLLPLPPLDPPVEEGTVDAEPLCEALRSFCEAVTVPVDEDLPDVLSGSPVDLAIRYVATECISDNPTLRQSYQDLPADQRRELHDQRADKLAAVGERSLGWGSVPYHHEHGTDPLGRAAVSLAAAIEDVMDLGLYHATVELCFRGRALVSSRQDPEVWWTFTTKLPTSLSALGRAEQAETICDEVRASLLIPEAHLRVAYATAMLYTRHRSPTRRDHERALGWINEAIVLSGLLPDQTNRAFNTVFHNNGLALIEVHRGRPEEALRLITEGIEHLDQTLGPDQHNLHRSVLRHNRAQVLLSLGRLDEALTDYLAVIEVDPNYPEYHFEIADLLHRLGRDDDALIEYETAIRLGPPFPEVYYNRADVLLDRGETQAALHDLDYVLELSPDFVLALATRAAIHTEGGRLELAQHDVSAGLMLDPGNAQLHAIQGQLLADRGEHDAAIAAFDRSLDLEPDQIPALCARAASAHETGQTQRALADLDRAVELAPDDAMLRFNRAFILTSDGRWSAALADLDLAATLAPEDPDILTARSACAVKVSA